MILVNTYKALNGTAPKYIQELVTPYQPLRSFRSETESFVCVPKTRTATYGKRCFGNAAAILWNGLPTAIRKADTLAIFKKRVKTHLFQTAF